MNAVLIDELKSFGLQYHEQQMLKRGESQECLESVAKRLRRRQMYAMVFVLVITTFPVLITMLFAIQFRDREIQNTAGNAMLPMFVMMGLWQMMNLVEVVRQISRCEMLALLTRLENQKPAEMADMAA